MKVTNFVIDFRRSRCIWSAKLYGNGRECYARDRRISVVPSVSKYRVTGLHRVLAGQ